MTYIYMHWPPSPNGTANSNDYYCFHNNRIHMEMKGRLGMKEKYINIVYNADGF